MGNRLFSPTASLLPHLNNITPEAQQHFDQGMVHARRRNWEEAIKEFCIALDISPRFIRALQNRGLAYWYVLVLLKLLVRLSDLVRIKEQQLWNIDKLMPFTSFLKKYELALDDFNKSIEIDPKHDGISTSYHHRGWIHHTIGNLEKAIQDYSRAIELEPDYYLAHNNRGQAYQELGNFDAAIKDHTTAIALHPEEDLAYNNRGFDYNSLGEYHKAIEDLEKCVTLAPGTVSFQQFL
jgi:tetratricopeptide (TPR) repeat protein